jgi:hypothetical protein
MFLPPSRSRTPGSALIMSIVLMLLVGIMAGSLFMVQFHRTRLKIDYINKIEAYYGAEGALNLAAERVWDGYLEANGGAPGNLDSLQTYLNANSVVTIPRDKWVTVPLDQIALGPLTDATVQAYRTDGTDYTELRFRSSATIMGHTETIDAAFMVPGGHYRGFDFALFANNITCTLCHARVDNVKKDSGQPYPRARVATLETLMVRRTTSDSIIKGTLYAQGQVMNKDGTPLTDAQLASGTTQVWANTFDASTGLLDPASSVSIKLKTAGTDADGNPLVGQNFYRNYPTDPAKQTDGDVPSEFPSVFFDENKNQVIDDSEFASVAKTANGTATGFGYVIPQGSSYSGPNLGGISDKVTVSGTVDGNLILVGDNSNPIILNKNIVVDGDLVIQGPVQGTGSIVARGNVYITGDLTYNDKVVGGVRQFGVAPDGSQNTLGIAAGGNIEVGDFLTPREANLQDPTKVMNGKDMGTTIQHRGFGFAISQIATFNRKEWQKTQQTLPDRYGNPVANSTYDPTYKPRYYTLDPATPVWIFLKTGTGTTGVTEWDNTNTMWKTYSTEDHAQDWTQVQEVTPATIAAQGAAMRYLNPLNNWLTPQKLKSFWAEGEGKRTAGDPLKVDGLLYTDNALMTMTARLSNTQGNMIVNGALVARDLGVLVPGLLGGTDNLPHPSFYVNYDERVKNLLNLRDTNTVALRRTLFVKLNPTIETR